MISPASRRPRGESTDARRPKVALLGCGQWGKNIARSLASLGALSAVCDSNPVTVQGARTLYPDVDTATDPGEIFARGNIDACVIATPPLLHANLARQALEAGKDVLVEKPLALTARDGAAVVETAEKHRRILMVGHLLEYHPAVERLRELVTGGELGKIQYVYSNRLNLGRIRTEENALWSFAPHDIHVMLRLLGESPTSVACHGASYLSREVADVTLSTLTFESGVQGHIFVSWLHPYKEQKLVVVGERAMAVFDDTLPVDKLQLYPHRVDWIKRVPVAVKAEAQTVTIADVEPLLQECAHFIACVASRQRPRTDGANGVEVLEILEACQQSLEHDGAPISRRPVERRPPSPRPAYMAHPTAILDSGCEIGDGTQIWHYTHVMADAKIGRNCRVGQNVFVAKDVVVGDNVKIQNNVSLFEGVILEEDVFCGPSMVFTNVLSPRSAISRRNEFRRTIVRRGATIGANATILCGVTIGAHAFVGAGAVLTRDLPDYALAYGNPARIRGWMCPCGIRIVFDPPDIRGACPSCGRVFSKDGDIVIETTDEATGRGHH